MLNNSGSLAFLTLLSWLGNTQGVSNIFSLRSILYNRQPKAKVLSGGTSTHTSFLSEAMEIGDYVYYHKVSDRSLERSDGETAERVNVRDKQLGYQ